jgi:hypothetical protein
MGVRRWASPGLQSPTQRTVPTDQVMRACRRGRTRELQLATVSPRYLATDVIGHRVGEAMSRSRSSSLLKARPLPG